MKSLADNQLYRLCIAQFLETVREPEVLFWGMVFPILISIGLGLAFMQNTETKFRVMLVAEHVAELDSLLDIHASPGKNGRQRVWRIEDGTLGNTAFTFERADWHTAIIALKRGEADMIVDDSLGRVRYHFDPLNSQAQLACTRLSALMHEPVLPGETVQVQVSPLTLKGVRYIDFLVPGLIAFGIMADIL
ncbi:MAG: ABC transporter permease, partial [Tannerella sp.]|nr:ABC transporter permease [Tannerella sp.]